MAEIREINNRFKAVVFLGRIKGRREYISKTFDDKVSAECFAYRAETLRDLLRKDPEVKQLFNQIKKCVESGKIR
jgi:hypothetical protein